MRGVAARAIAPELGVDAGTAPDRVLALLEQEDAGALGHHEAVAIAVERPGGLLGLAGDRGERTERAVARDDHGCEGCVGAAREHRVGTVITDQRQCGADRVGAGRACGAGCRRGTPQAERACRRGGCDVGQRERDRERADAVGTALVVRLVGVASVWAPPWADPTEAPTRPAGRSRSPPASSSASLAAAAPSWPQRSIRRASRHENQSSGSNPSIGQSTAGATPGNSTTSRRCGRPRANPRTPRRPCPWGRSHQDP